MDAIKTENLTKTYKTLTAVDNLTLDVHRGELFALLGVNGAGKTTTIKMLCGLSAPTAGSARILGLDISDPKVKKHIAVSPQETAIAPNLTVEENLRLLCGIHGLDPKERIGTAVRELGLTEVLRRRAGKLSGGWQRRLSIAMALISQPEVLFLDEPTLGLDVIARSELWALIRSLKGKVTVILTTHYMEEAEALSDRIGIMKNGRLLALGTADELKAKAGKDKFEEAFIAIVKGADQ